MESGKRRESWLRGGVHFLCQGAEWGKQMPGRRDGELEAGVRSLEAFHFPCYSLAFIQGRDREELSRVESSTRHCDQRRGLVIPCSFLLPETVQAPV